MTQSLHSTDLPCACGAIRKANRAISRLYDEALSKVGLTANQFSLLSNLDSERETPLSRLAETMVMDRTSLYRVLNPLIREKMIEVRAAERGRAKLARLTPSGRKRLSEAMPHWTLAQERIVAPFGPERWKELEAALRALAAPAGQD